MPDPAEPRRGPMTEADLRAAWVVEPPKLTAKLQVVDYDPEWPGLFRREADRIRAVLGERVVRLEHIGSTSVPGLAAKPIIDILLVVPDSGGRAGLAPGPGGGRVPAGHPGTRLVPAPLPQGARTPTSTCTSTRPAARRSSGTCVFRDRLRGHPEDRAHYQRVKRELAERDWTYVQEYADAKTEVVEAIIARARAAGAGG